MLKEIEFDNTWIHKVDEETMFECQPVGGAMETPGLGKHYFAKGIIRVTGITYRKKGIKEWLKRTGVAKYTNGKEAYVGQLPFHLFLPPKVAAKLLEDIMEHSVLDGGEIKN